MRMTGRLTTRILFAAAFVAAVGAGTLSMPTAVFAQATCRSKCNDQEQACLKRTGNKGQCGDRAKTCLAKCK